MFVGLESPWILWFVISTMNQSSFSHKKNISTEHKLCWGPLGPLHETWGYHGDRTWWITAERITEYIIWLGLRLMLNECYAITGWWFQTWILLFHFIYGMSSFPLTNSYFSRWLKPPTCYNIGRKKGTKRCWPSGRTMRIATGSWSQLLRVFTSDDSWILQVVKTSRETRLIPWWIPENHGYTRIYHLSWWYRCMQYLESWGIIRGGSSRDSCPLINGYGSRFWLHFNCPIKWMVNSQLMSWFWILDLE